MYQQEACLRRGSPGKARRYTSFFEKKGVRADVGLIRGKASSSRDRGFSRSRWRPSTRESWVLMPLLPQATSCQKFSNRVTTETQHGTQSCGKKGDPLRVSMPKELQARPRVFWLNVMVVMKRLLRAPTVMNRMPRFARSWHLWWLAVPRRSISGRFVRGHVWRCYDGKRWNYMKVRSAYLIGALIRE
jgi:hypothetical protein